MITTEQLIALAVTLFTALTGAIGGLFAALRSQMNGRLDDRNKDAERAWAMVESVRGELRDATKETGRLADAVAELGRLIRESQQGARR